MRWVDRDEVVLRIDPRLYERFERDELHQALAIAALAWRGTPGVPRIRFEATPPPPVPDADGVAGIYLDRDWLPEDGALAVTLVAYESGTGRMVDADVVLSRQRRLALLDEEVEPEGEEPVYDLASLVAHELGHVLGLDESRDAPEATMWPTQPPWDVEKRDLAEDDREALRVLYGEGADTGWSADLAGGSPGVGSDGGPPGGCGGASVAGPPRLATVALLLWVLSLLGWRRARAPARRRRVVRRPRRA